MLAVGMLQSRGEEEEEKTDIGDGDGAGHGLWKWGILRRGWTVADSAAHAHPVYGFNFHPSMVITGSVLDPFC